jgi:hypothetical protein
MLLINLVALGAFGVGFVLGWRIIKKGRMPYRLEGSLVEWDESPAPATHYDRLAAALIMTHSVAVVLLCALLVVSVNRAGDGPFSMVFHSPIGSWLAGIVGFEDRQTNDMSLFIAMLSAGIAAFTCGGIVSFPFSRRFIRPVHVHIHPQGVVYGQNSAQWHEVSSYQIDRERGIFKLFTQKHPNTPSFALRPGEGLFEQVEKTLGELIPGKQGAATGAGSKSRDRRAFLFIVATVVLLIVAFWMYQYVAELVWFIYAAMIVAYSAIGTLIAKI